MPGGRISNAPENKSFAVSFMYLKLRRKGKIIRRWEKVRQGSDYRIAKITVLSHALEGGV